MAYPSDHAWYDGGPYAAVVEVVATSTAAVLRSLGDEDAVLLQDYPDESWYGVRFLNAVGDQDTVPESWLLGEDEM